MRFLAFVFALSISMTSHAVVVSDLYSIDVVVESQSVEHRDEAMQDAFFKVLAKVTGNFQLIENPSIIEESQQAASYVRSFRYDRTAQGITLKINFIQDLIERFVRQQELALWGKNRPLILVWQGVEVNKRRQVLSQESSAWQLMFEEVMNEYGLPMLWPTRDFDDQNSLPDSHIWGFFSDNIHQASQRYLTDSQLVGTLAQRADGSWAYKGYLQHQQQRLPLNTIRTEPNAAIRDVAQKIVTELASYYAVNHSSTARTYQIEVTHVQNFQDYRQLLDFLKSNIAIKHVHVESTQATQLLLALELSDTWDKVWSMLALDKRLVATQQPQVFRWQP